MWKTSLTAARLFGFANNRGARNDVRKWLHAEKGNALQIRASAANGSDQSETIGGLRSLWGPQTTGARDKVALYESVDT